MRSAIWSKWSDWELRKAGPPMTLSMEMSFVRSPSFHASYLLGHGVAALEPAVEAEPPRPTFSSQRHSGDNVSRTPLMSPEAHGAYLG